jgi:hypothetical protein
MRKPLLLLPAGVVIAVAVAASTGGAQTPDGRTVTVFQDVSHESSKFVDHAPKRLSMGDEHFARTPVLDRRGGSRVGTLYANAAVVRGTSFRTAVFEAQAVLAVEDGTITLSGLAGTASRPFAVTGGTGAYSGARGTASEKEVRGGARLVVRLLP